MKITQKPIKFFTGILILGVFCISGCDRPSNSNSTVIEQTASTPPVEPPPPQPYTREAKLVAVGDIMMHGSQIKSGYNPSTKTYNYDNFFTEVKEIISQGDWAIGNLETTLAGSETGYTGYPMFNAPDTLADAIKNAGFNVLTTANNHSLDRREAGVLKTLENVRSRGIEPVGTAASAEEDEEILILEKNEISMAILAYTYGTNGIPIPEGKDYLVNLIDEAEIIEDIQAAEDLGVDVVTVALHFGSEYQRQPNQQQKQLVKSLVDAGADIILGSHPHVVQPYEVFERTDKSGNIQKAVAIYSMGNFISNQRGDYKDLGVIFKVNIRKYFPEETIEFTEIQALPTWVHRYSANNKYNFRILPLEKTVTEKNDPLLPQSEYSVLSRYLDQMNRHIHSLNPSKTVTKVQHDSRESPSSTQ
ncbi:bacterial capsule synthesis PGA_cap family protein [Lyngbya aestuarii BL J]|uniref:Bacterial capsule synthesis PGA_cap family protein n=1 Tax=Lyngbya aestuarii BL J TaxID=1348334 RepID=U7QQL6_9CYAN|nr:CapA family protein [Lyngbya aestuarii]ERT09567.1 bacterial capsule synthesis PGA_cap family protein [Lyngbya aestuarii BL J]